jgi:acyl-ACP thioesterase
MVPLPERGRVFRGRRRVRLGDAAPSQRLRFDACARYLQDLGNDDTADSGIDPTFGVWVVRRAVIDVLVPPVWGEWLDLATWCGGTGERGGRVEVNTLWVHLDPATMAPARLPEEFMVIYGEAAGGRRVSGRRSLGSPPTGGEAAASLQRMPWPLRAVDYDVMRHVNNAAYWTAVEELLAAEPHRDLVPRPEHPVRAVLEFGRGIGFGSQVELVAARDDKQLDLWFTVDGDAYAAARLLHLRP